MERFQQATSSQLVHFKATLKREATEFRSAYPSIMTSLSSCTSSVHNTEKASVAKEITFYQLDLDTNEFQVCCKIGHFSACLCVGVVDFRPINGSAMEVYNFFPVSGDSASFLSDNSCYLEYSVLSSHNICHLI